MSFVSFDKKKHQYFFLLLIPLKGRACGISLQPADADKLTTQFMPYFLLIEIKFDNVLFSFQAYSLLLLLDNLKPQPTVLNSVAKDQFKLRILRS
jgi:hypothetical protein